MIKSKQIPSIKLKMIKIRTFITSMRYHYTPEWLLSKRLHAINAGEGVEKREPSYTVGGNAN